MSSNKNYYCAIDLGTTNTTFAFGMVNPKTGKLEAKCIQLKMKLAEGGVGRENVVPSCVLIDVNENGEVVPTVGPYAKHMNTILPQNVVVSTKSDMGKNKVYEIEGKLLTPVDISAFIVDFVLNNAKEYFRERPDDIVITVPASFDSEMRMDTINAAKKAGIRVIEDDGSDRNILLDEPRAALHNFINSLDKGELPETLIDISTPKNVLVYDLGGGTLDVSLHKVWRDENNEVEFEDYAISLHTLVGGDNFDKLFSEYLYSCIENKISSITDAEKVRCMSKLRVLAEKAKIDMSNQAFENSMMGFDDDIEVEITQANIHDNIGIDELVTEEEYEEIVESLMANDFTLDTVKDLADGAVLDSLNIIYPILDVLVKANEKAGEDVKVDAVLLNGGMTNLPLIQKRLEDFFGLEPISVQNPDLSVALGGVYYHYNLHNGKKAKTILNDSIGIETSGGHVEHLAKAGVTLPHKSKVFDNFSVSSNGITKIDIPFYLGNRSDVLSPNRKIADRSIKFDKPLNENDKISLQLEINEAGILITRIWINDDESNRRIMEVDSKYVDSSANVVHLDDNAQTYSLNKNKAPVVDTVYVDTDENIVGKNVFNELEKFCKQHEKTNNNGTKKNFMNQIKLIEAKIKACSNKHEMMKLLSDEIRNGGDNYFYKERLCIILGEISKITGLNSDIIQYTQSEINVLRHLSNVSPCRKRYLRSLLESLAKSRDERVEGIFMDALELNQNIIKQFKNAIIISLGKVSDSIDVFDLIYNNADGREFTPEELWALGKIGSREKENPLNIKDIDFVIDDLLDVVEYGSDKYVLAPYNALYALAEICDRRNGHNCIDDRQANKIIKAVSKAKLRDYTAAVQLTQFDQIKEISLALVSGSVLTDDQEKCLLEIRSKLKVTA